MYNEFYFSNLPELDDFEFEDFDGEDYGKVYKNDEYIGFISMWVDSDDEFGVEIMFETGDDDLIVHGIPDELDLIQEVSAHLGCEDLDITVKLS